MKKTTNELIIEQLLIAQENARNQAYPGYPYQDSIIVDCDNKIAFNHFGYSASEETILNELYARLLFKVLGDRKATKPTWLNDREIASKEDYCDKDIGNLLKAFMFIDSDWIKPIHKFRDWFNFMLNEEDRKDIKESYEQDTECEFNFDEIEKNYTHFETSPTWFNAFNSNNQNCDFEQFSDMLERYIDNYDDDELLRFYCRFENKVRELEKESQD